MFCAPPPRLLTFTPPVFSSRLPKGVVKEGVTTSGECRLFDAYWTLHVVSCLCSCRQGRFWPARLSSVGRVVVEVWWELCRDKAAVIVGPGSEGAPRGRRCLHVKVPGSNPISAAGNHWKVNRCALTTANVAPWTCKCYRFLSSNIGVGSKNHSEWEIKTQITRPGRLPAGKQQESQSLTSKYKALY